MTLWLLVTDDKYEYPLIMCESRKELADIVGILPTSISEAISRAKRKGERCRYAVIRFDENEED